MTQSSSPKDASLTYLGAGVDIDAGNALVRAIAPLAARTKRRGVMGGIGGFGGLFDPAAAGYHDPVLVAGTDGVGTKLRLAIEIGRHDTIGIDLVAMCVNDLIVQGAEPLFFLDYFACGTLDVATAECLIQGIAEGCVQAGCALLGGETAEMPGHYPAGDYDLAGFAVGAAERTRLLPRSDIAEGDVILGLASSGVHSNGFSLVRRIVARSGLAWDAAAPFQPMVPLGEALLTPTRLYVKPLLAVFRNTEAIKALAHITGGGLVENVHRVLPDDLAAEIDLTQWRLPQVFAWLRDEGRLDQQEMLRTFNSGIGMVAVTDPKHADRVGSMLEAAGEQVYRIGRITAREGGAPVYFLGRLEPGS